MNAYMLIDFGSTYTKITAVDIENEEVLGTSKAITTVEEDIMIGFNKAKQQLYKSINEKDVKFIKKLACSSAAGGLKMVAIGLVPELTVEAAKRAALGAGARVIKVYSYELSKHEIQEIESNNIDIILLAGGTDGGNKECILNNANILANSGIKSPIVVAGNKSASDNIEDIFKTHNIDYCITENVMPKLNKLNVEPAREEIRKIFMNKIVEAKGLKSAESYINSILMPTPAAVLKAANILSVGTKKEDGLGDLIVVDIGGATTDVHSIGNGEPTKPGVTLRGLQEPFAKRTVEGDLGMRYSAMSLYEASGEKNIRKYLINKDINIEKNCYERCKNIKMIPKSEEEMEFDEAMAMIATELAVERHAGHIESMYTPMGAIFTQIGKDLTATKYFIGTGGVLVHSKNPNRILKAGMFSKEQVTSLKPEKPNILIDKAYILSAMGLLAEYEPDIAVRIMKKYLVSSN